MKSKRVAGTDFSQYLGEDADWEKEAEKHPLSLNGFTHWSSPGWSEKDKCPMVTLTFDPDCPRCKELESE